MEDSEEEEFLNLSLSVASNREKKKKGKIIMRDHASMSPMMNSYEGKIFRLLQMREQMLRQELQRRKGVVEDGNGLPLIHLLLTTATAVDENNLGSALENLTELYKTVSLTGDSVQRVVAYFADGLAARLLTRQF
ncbi:hypothetical protein L6164_007059 [Bauhinia variegata]|uniref:Uncharacterized protein n=1 Tax=Bauhinia variegata TaxID=167791 RepID=A0ACB9PYG9_BAUVA|nr:hypothetical protein L6164_007059 [Bauhinia variegata]